MSLRRSVGTVVVAFTISGAGAAPAAAHFFTADYQPYVAPSLVHQNLEAGVRQHKHASGGSQGQAGSGVGKRDGLPTGGS